MPWMSANLIKNFFGGPATRLYPVAKRPPFPAARARVVFNPARCTYCGICANICPSGSIRMEDDRENLLIGRFYDSFSCIYCAKCVELCPNGALTMGVDHLESTDTKLPSYSGSK